MAQPEGIRGACQPPPCWLSLLPLMSTGSLGGAAELLGWGYMGVSAGPPGSSPAQSPSPPS